MSSYPPERPQTLDDVRRGHVVGKVTKVTPENSLWLRDALDIALDEIGQLQTALRKLRNEAAGLAGWPDLRESIGNTNMAVLEQRIAEAEALLPTKDSNT